MTSTQEKFSQELVKNDGDARAAYLAVNPHAAASTLSTAVSKHLNNPEIKQRVRRILDEEGITLEHCARKHKKFLNRTNGTGLKALELAYKLHGALEDENKSAPVSLEGIEINIMQQVVEPQAQVQPACQGQSADEHAAQHEQLSA